MSNPVTHAHWRQYLTDSQAAFADLGTFLPLVLGLIALNQFSAQGIFLGFGVFALASAYLYRRPVGIQPMKVIAAVTITAGLSPGVMQASSLLIGMILIVLVGLGAIRWLAQHLSPAISAGIQLAVGMQLMWVGLQQVQTLWWLGVLTLLGLWGCRHHNLKHLAIPTIILGGIFIGWSQSPQLPALTYPSMPWLSWPSWQEFELAASLLVLPQLALTLTNAVIASSVIALQTFPDDNPQRFTPSRFAMSSGITNIVMAPFGASAMCHGAGGMAVQTHFGARTVIAPLTFGLVCLGLALFWHQSAASYLSLIPMPMLGALLIVAGAQLANAKPIMPLVHLLRDKIKGEAIPLKRGYCLVVIVATAAVCLFLNPAVGLVVGFMLESQRKRVMTSISSSKSSC
ncbi:putative sulfate/molybdate transporter [Shewanella sp. NIFS-20-20]|uniref:putative sulfate/molybdate transporter n=1 Tax=Shewanella sp. NIFS-20-20 TaxID=2853806 RepID=UPI001C44A210|nr:putative sulfate/molybdate transporter [Shewanella sp. NIFS-20-20]MBV7314504.1 putative sulfate/molybdate transporter [Shewanella sp. NIFS-20-20]